MRAAHNRRCANELMAIVVTIGFAAMATADDAQPIERGRVEYVASPSESSVPVQFRLPDGSFEWRAERMQTVTDTLEVWDVMFPSPVTTPEEANNTVHCEY